MSDIKYEFFMSQIRNIYDIKENERTKLSVVFYEGIRSNCILRICKNRDLSDVYEKLMKIKNPNIVVVYDYVYANNNTYILLEHISGKTLEEMLNENGILSEKETAKIIINVCKGLEILHKCQPPIVHNDINTSNIMIRDDGSVKVFDFDVSRTYKSGAGKNTELFGTEEYASPEHYGYGQSEPRTDIYSLGVTMHKMLSGKSLDSEHKMVYTGKLKKIVKKCIQIDPKKRYSSVSKLQKDLESFLDKKKNTFKILMPLGVILLGVGVVWGMKDKFGNVFNKNDALEEKNDNDTETNEKINDSTIENNSENNHEKYNEEVEQGLKESNSSLKGNNEDEATELNTDKNIEDNTDKSEQLMDNNDSELKTESDKYNNNSVQSEENIVQSDDKKMNVVRDSDYKIYSLVSLNDDTYVWIEREKTDYYIKDSKGNEVEIKEINNSYSCELAYDSYSDKLYLFQIRHMDPQTTIYEVKKDYSVKELVTKGNGIVYGATMWDELRVDFFSDGIMYCDFLGHDFVDSNSWSDVGETDTLIHGIINDKMYAIKRNDETLKYSVFEIDFLGNEVKEYQFPYIEEFYGIDIENSYCDNKYLYFIMSLSGKDYVYRFNGQKFEEYDCLNDYKYYTESSVGKLCVTKDSILMLNLLEGTIKEFK